MSDDDNISPAKRYKSNDTSDLETSPILVAPTQDLASQNSKIFNDPIHGSIEFHWLLVKVIDTPEFQRLRRLKQLGVTYCVFPSACHSRFEHSLGTAHLAGELLFHLCQKQPELEITPKDILCVQMAALCHDLGHGPYSHMFEEVINKLRPDLKWAHETATIKMFDYIIKKNELLQYFEQCELDETDLIFIKELIHSERMDTNSNQIWPYKGRSVEKSFLYEIVSNKLTGIDVDKFDYFSRDSFHLGRKISFEHMRFIKFYRVIQASDGRRHLCLRDKEVKACYEIYRTRDDLHRCAYQHPVVKCIEIMLGEAFIEANKYLFFSKESGEYNVHLADSIDDMYVYSQIDDHIVSLIKHSQNPNMQKAKAIINMIECRKIYQYIGNTHVKCIEDFKKNEFQDMMSQDIISCCQLNDEFVELTTDKLVLQIVELTCGDRGKDPLEKMWFYTKLSPNTATKISKEQVSTLLPESFCEHDIRLYCKIRDPTICQIVRYGFKEFCRKRKYPMPKVLSENEFI